MAGFRTIFGSPFGVLQGDRDGMTGAEAELVETIRFLQSQVEGIRQGLTRPEAYTCRQTQEGLAINLQFLQEEATRVRAEYDRAGFFRSGNELRILEEGVKQVQADLRPLRGR
jgi:hypothetical protein